MGRFVAPSWYSRPQLALDSIALFIADIQGLWAILFVYCTEPADEGGLGIPISLAGSIMLIQGLFSTFLAPFIGRCLDRTDRKRLLFAILPVLVLTIAWGTFSFVEDHSVVLVLLAIMGIAGGAYPPGICSLSFGVVGNEAFPARAARNEMAKHIGAIVTAGLFPIVLVAKSADEGGWTTYFIVMTLVQIMAGVSLLLLRDTDVLDHEKVGRGSRLPDEGSNLLGPDYKTITPISEVLRRSDVLLFMASMTAFHIGNAAMLPQLGYKMDTIYNDNSTATGAFGVGDSTLELNGKNSIAVVTIISQIVMIPIAKLSGKFAQSAWVGSKRLLMFGCLVLASRGVWIATDKNPESMLWSAVFDGIAAGIFGVCSILLMSDLTEGTGQFAAMQGMVATCLGLGSSFSHGFSAWVAQVYGVDTTMFILAGFSFLPFILLIFVPDNRQRRLASGSMGRFELLDTIIDTKSEAKAREVMIDNPTFMSA